MNSWSIYYRLRDSREGIARNGWASLATAVFLYFGDVIQSSISSLIPFMAGQLSSPELVIGIVLVTGPVLALLGGGIASQRAIGWGDR